MFLSLRSDNPGVGVEMVEHTDAKLEMAARVDDGYITPTSTFPPERGVSSGVQAGHNPGLEQDLART